MIEESPDFLIDFLKAHEEASNLIRNNPQNAARIASMEIDFIDKDFVLKTFAISPKYCTSVSKEYINSTLKFNEVLKNLGYIEGNLSRKDIFDLRFIKEVHPEDPHYNFPLEDKTIKKNRL